VRAVSATCGVFERLVTRTILVLPRPSLDHSDVKVTLAAKGNTLRIRMSPADQYGNLLGPGFGHQVLLTLDDEPSGRVRDNLNGSYEIELKYQAGEKRLVSLWVAGERLMREPIHKLVQKGKK
jgi:hypothetical protein